MMQSTLLYTKAKLQHFVEQEKNKQFLSSDLMIAMICMDCVDLALQSEARTELVKSCLSENAQSIITADTRRLDGEQ